MKPRRRSGACSAAAALGLLLTGCGIPGTDVVEAGEPAAVTVPGRSDSTLLFFVSPSGELTPVLHQFRPDGAGQALLALRLGPDEADRAAGLTTQLPPFEFSQLGRTGDVQVKAAKGRVDVVVDMAVNGLSETARNQVLCTLAHAEPKGESYEVKVTGSDGVIGPGRCPLDAA
ncbi:hypothetical protein [Streptomyces sp. NBC_00829]|uniref:hypothetical protein n=1 Tax=Streptomyces sp. NBC_00829 TaxID=2903679 RepID=UPI003869816C|nr:hypothetical protein OG293_06200 [Streptomyces sp. NBC_00829]